MPVRLYLGASQSGPALRCTIAKVRLGELLAQREFKLRLLRGSGGERAITGAHAIEVNDPGRWIAPGYLVLTTGLAMRGSVQKQRDFVDSLARARAGAIGFGVGVNFVETPRGVLRAAEEAKLPVFEVPLETAFRDLIRFVLSANASEDVRQLYRVSSMQDYLLAALDEPRPEQVLVDRMVELMGGRGAVFTSGGELIAASGVGAERLWRSTREGAELTVDAAGSTVHVAVHVEGVRHWELLVGARTERPADTLVRPLVRFAARVLELVALRAELERDRDRFARAALLRDLLTNAGRPEARAGELSAAGFALAREINLLVAGTRALAIVRALDRAFEARGEPRLVGLVDSEAIAIWQGDPDPPTVAGVAIGIARPAPLAQLPQALVQARAALLASEGGGSDRVSFEQLPLPELLLGLAEGSAVVAAADVLAPLAAQKPELLRTLKVFFACDLDIGATASALELHPNSVRYRLARLEEVLGSSLRSPATIAELYLGLSASRIVGQTQASAVKFGASTVADSCGG
jgi:purine catabolism regulator